MKGFPSGLVVRRTPRLWACASLWSACVGCAEGSFGTVQRGAEVSGPTARALGLTLGVGVAVVDQPPASAVMPARNRSTSASAASSASSRPGRALTAATMSRARVAHVVNIVPVNPGIIGRCSRVTDLVLD